MIRISKKKLLKELKKLVCIKCELEGHCAEDVECNTIENIKKLFVEEIKQTLG